MNLRKIVIIAVTGAVILLLSFASCSSGITTTTVTATTTPTGPGGGAVVNSDSIITGTIKAIRPQTTGYPWEVDVLIQSSQNVGDLPNPTSDKIGQVVTLKTDQDMTLFTVDQSIFAKVKYTGDVPKPGITLYLYKITSTSGGY